MPPYSAAMMALRQAREIPFWGILIQLLGSNLKLAIKRAAVTPVTEYKTGLAKGNLIVCKKGFILKKSSRVKDG
jgi:hypothetical protein